MHTMAWHYNGNNNKYLGQTKIVGNHEGVILESTKNLREEMENSKEKNAKLKTRKFNEGGSTTLSLITNAITKIANKNNDLKRPEKFTLMVNRLNGNRRLTEEMDNENIRMIEEDNAEKRIEEDEENDYDMGKKGFNKDECNGYHIHLPRNYNKSVEDFIETNFQSGKNIGLTKMGENIFNFSEIVYQFPFYTSLISQKRNDISLSHKVRRKFEIKIRLNLFSNKDTSKVDRIKVNAIDSDDPLKKYDLILLQLKNEISDFSDQRLSSTASIPNNIKRYYRTRNRRNPWHLSYDWILRSVHSGKLYEMNKETESFMGKIYRSMTHYSLVDIDIPNKKITKKKNRKVKEVTFNKMRGSTTKLVLTLERDQKILFKIKRRLMTDLIKGKFWPAFDSRERFQCEIMAFHLSRVLDFRKTPITAGRRFHLFDDILLNDKNKIIRGVDHNEKLNGSYCFKFYKGETKNNVLESSTICTDQRGFIEGAMLMWLPFPLGIIKNPWHPKFWSEVKENCDGHQLYDISNEYCSKNLELIIEQNEDGLYERSQTTILLDIIDIAIYDFLLDNIDRSSFEYMETQETLDDIPFSLIMIDSGNCFPDPNVDTFTTLAPLYQCCKLRRSTYERLKLLQNGQFVSAFNLSLSADMLHPFLIEPHWIALNRRYNAVMSVIQDWCFIKFEKANVLS
ncbi:unnamed protein product [Gordionus sp. m RMFG-2023]